MPTSGNLGWWTAPAPLGSDLAQVVSGSAVQAACTAVGLGDAALMRAEFLPAGTYLYTACMHRDRARAVANTWTRLNTQRPTLPEEGNCSRAPCQSRNASSQWAAP